MTLTEDPASTNEAARGVPVFGPVRVTDRRATTSAALAAVGDLDVEVRADLRLAHAHAGLCLVTLVRGVYDVRTGHTTTRPHDRVALPGVRSASRQRMSTHALLHATDAALEQVLTGLAGGHPDLVRVLATEVGPTDLDYAHALVAQRR